MNTRSSCIRAATAVGITVTLVSGAAHTALLGEPALSPGQNIRHETGEISLNGSSATVVRYTWRDSVGNPRSVSLIPAAALTGYAVQMTYVVAVPGDIHTVYVNADPAGDGGFGYFVSHELFRSFSDGSQGTIAARHGEDDSPLGRYLPSTGTAQSVGQNQAVHEFRLSYPRWGTVATVPDPSVGTISGAGADHQKFMLPVIIRWSFVAGQNYPLWSVDYDLTAASDHIATDVRAPYGVMRFNEGNGADVTALRWGDKYKFAADVGADFGGAAVNPGGVAWTWNTAHEGRRYNVLGSGAYELGIVDTVLRPASKYADGYADHRNTTSAGGGCAYGLKALPCDWEWAYQSFQYDYGPPTRPKLAWGSSPFLGSSITTVYVTPFETETLSGKGHISYGVHIVFGRYAFGTPLTLTRAAAALEASPALTVNASPAQGGTVSYAVLGDAGGPYSDAGRILAPWASLRLTATAAAGYAFGGWSGGCAGVAGAVCIIAMDQAKSVTANFNAGADMPNIDLDGDGRSDLLWRNATDGRLFRMLMNGFVRTSEALVYTEPNVAWQVVATGDFNGDGVSDLAWRNTVDGRVFLMRFNANGLAADGAVIHTEPNQNWKIVHAPDLDGDLRADLLWWNAATGQVYAMLMDGYAIVKQGIVYTEPDTNWRIESVGDFARSGRENQLLWRNAATGLVFLMTVNVTAGGFSQSGLILYHEPDLFWRVVTVADFDGDERSDILWRNDATGQVFMMLMNGAAIANQGMVYQEANLNWKVVATGDYNGDGKADLLWRNTQSGQVYMMLMNGRTIASQALVYTEPNTSWKILGPFEFEIP